MQINITRKDIEFCRRMIAEYLAKAEALEAKAETCHPGQRGGLLSHAAQRRKDASRMEANYDAQMGWLVENNFKLYCQLKAEEK